MAKNLKKLSPKERTYIFQGKTLAKMTCAICKTQFEFGDRYIGNSGYERHLACLSEIKVVGDNLTTTELYLIEKNEQLQSQLSKLEAEFEIIAKINNQLLRKVAIYRKELKLPV